MRLPPIRRWKNVDAAARAPRGARGIAHLEGKMLSNTEEVRFDRWIGVLRAHGIVTTPYDQFTTINTQTVRDDKQLFIVAGRTYVNDIPVFTCTRCTEPTTDTPDKAMRHVWPPDKDWSMVQLNPKNVPKKLRKYHWALLVCPTHTAEVEKILREKAMGNETSPVQD